MKKILVFAAIGEIATGAALLLMPSLVGRSGQFQRAGQQRRQSGRHIEPAVVAECEGGRGR